MLKKIIFVLILFFVSVTVLLATEKYALLIGINNYKSSNIRDLNYSEADALYLKDALIKYARYKPNNVKILLGNNATYHKIKQEIYWLGGVAERKDQVFFYFSGHGTRVDDTDGNEADGMDEAFCPFETDTNNPASLILDDELGHWFRRIKAKEIVVALDCCHSGGAAGRSLENDGSRGVEMVTKSTGRGLLDVDDDPYAKDLTIANKFIMTASDADEQSYENPKLGHGVFTYYMGEGIRGNADLDNDRKISATELYRYTRTKTLEFSKSMKGKQTPYKFGALKNVLITDVGNQICDIKLFDRDLSIVGLGIGGNMVKKGDIFLVKKSLQRGARDLEIADRDVFKVEITDVRSNYCEGEIVEAFYKNLNIDPSRYGEYYAEKLALGSVFIKTTPWATVYLDGKNVGDTPLIVHDVAEGEHDLEFQINVMGYPKRVQTKITVIGKKKIRVVEKFAKNRR